MTAAAPAGRSGRLLAISDLHVGYAENRRIVAELRPESDDDWLLVAGDVGELMSDVAWTLLTLSQHFSTVVWAPGNHELWTPPGDDVQLRGVARYWHIVEYCRRLGVYTPEDPYPVWQGRGGPLRIVPMFLHYDYSYRLDGIGSKQAALKHAFDASVVCTDEVLLFPDPFPDQESWCWDRVAYTERRLVEAGPLPIVPVNHYPLVREPTRILRYPDFALWCGTERTADWHTRFPVAAMVYGHLHIPRTTWHDGVRFEEVSLGYPHEWRRRGGPSPPRVIFPVEPAQQQRGPS